MVLYCIHCKLFITNYVVVLYFAQVYWATTIFSLNLFKTAILANEIVGSQERYSQRNEGGLG